MTIAKRRRYPSAKHTADLPTTEQKILAAARLEFSEKGLDGARMQAIADLAGTNKALLHYYFRSKEKLFEAALKEIVTGLWADVKRHLDAHQSETDLRTLINAIVTAYIATFAAQPALPKMIIREVTLGSPVLFRLVADVASSFNIVPDTIFTIYYKELGRGAIKRIAPVHFMMNLMGMCAVTFIIKPVVEHIVLRTGGGIVFDSAFYEKRIQAITEMACDGIFIDKRAHPKKRNSKLPVRSTRARCGEGMDGVSQ